MCPRIFASPFFLVTSTLVFGAGFHQPAEASDTPFGAEITVTATGEETPVDEVPVPVTVITREEIDDSQTDSVPTLLRRIPGLMISGTEGTGQVISTFTRGTNSNHTLFLYDGVRLNSPYFGGFDASTLSTAGVSRIEVARGPYSALWGAEALGGVINVVPLRADDGVQGRLVAEGGDGDWQRYEGDLRWGGGGFDIAASGISRQGRGALNNSDFEFTQGMIDVGYSWGEGRRVGVLVQDIDSETGVPFSSPGSPTPQRRSTSDQRLMAIPVRLAVSDSWRVQLAVSRVERRFHFEDPEDTTGYYPTDTDADSDHIRIASHHTLAAHTATIGGEWRQDEVTNVTANNTNLDGRTIDVSSLFFQDVWQITDRVRIVGGARWDDTDHWGSKTSPRLHIGYTATTNLQLTAGWGSAFRQPSAGELFYPFYGNPDLKPETADSWDIGATWRAPTTGSRIRLSLFDTTIEDLIQYDYVASANVNIGEASIRGAEFSLEQGFGAQLGTIFQVTWLDTEDTAKGEQLLRRPEWSGSATLHGRFTVWLSGDATIRYVGTRLDADPTTFATVEANAFVTADLALAMLIWDGMEITVRASDLFDEEYEEILGYPTPGRRISGGLRYEF